MKPSQCKYPASLKNSNTQVEFLAVHNNWCIYIENSLLEDSSLYWLCSAVKNPDLAEFARLSIIYFDSRPLTQFFFQRLDKRFYPNREDAYRLIVEALKNKADTYDRDLGKCWTRRDLRELNKEIDKTVDPLVIIYIKDRQERQVHLFEISWVEAVIKEWTPLDPAKRKYYEITLDGDKQIILSESEIGLALPIVRTRHQENNLVDANRVQLKSTDVKTYESQLGQACRMLDDLADICDMSTKERAIALLTDRERGSVYSYYRHWMAEKLNCYPDYDDSYSDGYLKS